MDESRLKGEINSRKLIEAERIKTRLAADAANCAVWDYVISEKCMKHSRKLNGRYQNDNKVIRDFRSAILKWGFVYSADMNEFDRLCRYLDKGEPSFSVDVRMINDTGRFAWFRFIGETINDDDGKPVVVAGITRDVTELRHGMGQIDDPSLCDSLTHLYNKGCVRNMLDEKIISKTSDDDSGLFFMIDIDNFKEIKDKWGHVFSDEILKHVASTLRKNMKSTDIIGYLGVDIFIVYCDDITDPGIAGEIASRILKCISNIVFDEDCDLSASIGISRFPEDGRDFDSLFRCADIALYHAKGNGKSTYAAYRLEDSNAIAAYEAKRAEEQDALNDARSMAEISDAQRHLFDFSFDTFNSSDNFDEAVSRIFREACIDFGLDVIMLIEYDYMTNTAKVTSEWYTDVREDKDVISGVYTKYWAALCRRYEECDRFIFDHLRTKDGIADEISASGRSAKSVMQLPIFDGEKLMAIINYEVIRNIKPWSYSEAAAITSISKMIGSYYLKTRNRRELEEETSFNGAAMKAQRSIYYVVDDKFRIVYISNFAFEAYPQIRIGEVCYKCMTGCDRQCDICPIKGIAEDDAGKNMYSVETYSDNEEKWMLKSAIKLHSNRNGGKYLICISDVTGFLTRVKFTDQLTGLMNYDKFVANAVRLHASVEKKYAIAFMGINEFAEINDEFGYSAGDRLLKKFAGLFSSILHEYELVARIKGDDFLLLLSYKDDIREVTGRITGVFDRLSGQMKSEFKTMYLDFMCGIYAMKDSDYSFAAAIDKASTARKEAVRKEPDPYRIFIYTKEYEETVRMEKEFENSMKEALANDEFKVYIQPKVTLPDGRIGGGEALVRWIKPDGTIIPPGKFIPLFERNGFVLDVDNYVYETILNQMHKWMREGKNVPQISMNVSRLHLLDDRFPAYFSELVDQYAIPHELVEIEITESVFFDNVERMINMISKLRSMHFPISMDDFGTGYSTLNLMKSLPIDILKIDGGFFLKCPLDSKNKAVISAIIHLGHSLNLRIVAEGIETKEQDDFIASEKCDFAQGYYHYRPMNMDAFGELL